MEISRRSFGWNSQKKARLTTMIRRARTVMMPKGTSTMPIPAACSATWGSSVPLKAVWLPASEVVRGTVGVAAAAAAVVMFSAAVVSPAVLTGGEVGVPGTVERSSRVGLGVGVRRRSGPIAVDVAMVRCTKR